MLTACSLVLVAAVAAAAPSPPVGAVTPVANGVDLLPGNFVPGHQPDGNTVVFTAPGGLVVVDTGRHLAHTQQIVDLAKARGLPVRSIVNTHWHLDHVGGNVLLRQRFPTVRVVASGAIDDALGGFLARYRAQLAEVIAAPDSTSEQVAAWKTEMALIDAGKALAPDDVVTASGPRDLAGRTLGLHLVAHAVTAGDLWIYDPATKVLVAGDLVTLPVPFLDTACPAHWQAALAELAKVDFATLVPGHGPLLSPADFATYRRAFDHLLTCGASSRPRDICVDGWLADIGGLVPAADQAFTRSLAEYYVDNSLRGDPAQAAKLCGR